MSNDKLPQSVTVKKLADGGARLAGKVGAGRLQRVDDAVLALGHADAKGGVNEAGFDVEMDFSVNEAYKSIIDVRINGAVAMQCQRCLSPVTVPINIATSLKVVAHDEEARSRIKECEPIVLEDGLLDIDSVIEDEVLLGLPLIAMHPTANENTNRSGQQACDIDGVFDVGVVGADVVGAIEASNDLPDASNASNASNASIEASTKSSIVETDKIERRSELGMNNPFEVLKTLKTGGGQE